MHGSGPSNVLDLKFRISTADGWFHKPERELATPMRMSKLCRCLVRSTASPPMALIVQGWKYLCIVLAFAGTAWAQTEPRCDASCRWCDSSARTNSYFVVLSASTRHHKKSPDSVGAGTQSNPPTLYRPPHVIVYILQLHKTMHRLPRPPTDISPMAVAPSFENMCIVSTCA
jgi:hypothetical protein